ncbi:MAG: pirin family protein [Anaerolineales bacterium]|nr:pirin family protein [Anaerolineales bacterium]
MNNIRTVKEIIEPQYAMEGARVLLRRSIAPQVSNRFDPFLLFDHFAFNDPAEGPIRGFPMHPHRGIETVSYILKGSVNHRDSLGNAGLIGPGDLQWMTAGGGILHEEMPRRGPDGIIDGFQLWVNLPAAQKMSSPRYKEVGAETIPVFEKNGCRVRVVAGTVDGIHGPVTEIAANPLYLDVMLEAGAKFNLPVPEGHTVLAYVFDGQGIFGNTEVASVKMAIFGEGNQIEVRASYSPVRFMLMAGAPFGEPIVPYGPFVMNTREEIQQALADLRDGTFVLE